MERQEVSEGGCGQVGHFNLDLPELGNGSEAPEAIHQGGASKANGSRPKKKQILTPAQKAHKKEWSRAYTAKRREYFRIKALEGYYKHRDRVLARKKAQRDANPNWSKEYYAKNKARIAKSSALWSLRNKDKRIKARIAYLPRRRELCKIRRAENPERKLIENFRSRIYLLVKRNSPTMRYKTYEILGCTPAFFREWLEEKFTPEMNWDNYGTYWEVDHMVPLASFDLSDPEKVKEAFHYSNCQPLHAEENNRKGCSLNWRG